MKAQTIQFLLDVAETITDSCDYYPNKISYEKGKYVIADHFIEDLKDIKKFLTSLGIKCSNISTGQSRHNCGMKYLKIDSLDEALCKIIIKGNQREIIHFEYQKTK